MIKVLVVDDSALLRKLFGSVLTKDDGFAVRFARNGLEALEALEDFEPDVVTLDVQMPGMDGLTCLDRIMVQRPCPVVMVSSLTTEGADTTLRALELGAVDFVAKPEGAVSLRMEAFAPMLVDKVRGAASARPRATLRLRERVRHRIGGGVAAGDAVRAQRPAKLRSGLQAGGGLVLVGISTGGPPALEVLLTDLPEDFPWPILIAQHMPANFTGPLARRLNAMCALNVVEVAHPVALVAGCAYIGRGEADLIVSRRGQGLVAMNAPAQPDYPWHPSTNRLVKSAMTQVPASQLIGVLMTGMGNDGVEAMTRLRAEGGGTIAEAEETAVVWGMPGELVKANGAGWILPLPGIAQRLLSMTRTHAANS